jgi:ribonuclease D
MNAIEPSQPPLQPAPNSRIVPRTRRQQRRHPNRAIAIETTAKLAVNVVLSSAAIAALVQLLPYHLSQQAKLGEIREEVKRTEKRVNRLSNNFSRYFDPQQAKSVMQEQSHRVDPSQRQVVWLDNNPSDE